MSTTARDQHRQWEELAVGFALHALEPAEEGTFAGHLRGCAECQESVQALSATAAELATMTEQAPPPTLRQAVLDAVAAEPAPPLLGLAHPGGASPDAASFGAGAPGTVIKVTSAGPSGVSAPPSPPRRNPRGPRRWPRLALGPAVLAAAAAVAALALGLAGPSHAPRPTPAALVARCVQDPGCRMVRLAAPDGHAVRATLLLRSGQATLVATGLAPDDPRSQIYVLWQMGRTGLPHALATFDVRSGSATTVSTSLRAPVDSTRAFAVSREHGRSAPVVPSPPVAVGTLVV